MVVDPAEVTAQSTDGIAGIDLGAEDIFGRCILTHMSFYTLLAPIQPLDHQLLYCLGADRRTGVLQGEDLLSPLQVQLHANTIDATWQKSIPYLFAHDTDL